MVAEGDLAGAGHGAAAHEARVGDGVVGGAEGAVAHEPGAGREQARDAVDAGHFQRLVVGHGREDGGDGAREQRLAAAGRPAHEQVVPAGGGDGERALGVLLADDLGEVGGARLRLAGLVGGRVGGDGGLPQQVRGELRERFHGVDVEPIDEGGLGRVGGGHEGALRAPVAGDGDHGQGPAHAAHLAVEGEFADEHGVAEAGLDLTAGDHDAGGDGQVVGGALLAQVGGGEVDDDAAVEGPGEGAVADGGAHALLRFLHGRVGQADDGGGGVLRARDVDLDVDHDAVETDDRAGLHFREHRGSLPFPRNGGKRQ